MAKSKAVKRLEAENRALRQRLRRREQLYSNDLRSRRTIGTKVPNARADYIKQLAHISGRCLNQFVQDAICRECAAVAAVWCKGCPHYEDCSPSWMPCRDGAILPVADSSDR